MSTRLDLDSACPSLMFCSAQAAQRDCARLAGEEGLSLYYEQIRHGGFPASPTGRASANSKRRSVDSPACRRSFPSFWPARADR